MSDSVVGRRRFINWFLGTSTGALLASILFPVVRYVSPPRIPEASTNEVEAGPTNDPEILEKGFKIVRFGADPVIVIKVAESEFRAFTATCTHLDCIVEFQKDKRRIFCNCHNGIYDLNGRNAGGPPPRPLDQFKVTRVARGGGKPEMIVVSRS